MEQLKYHDRILIDREQVLDEIRGVLSLYEIDHRPIVMGVLLKQTPLNFRELRRIHNGVERRRKLTDELVRTGLLPELRYRCIYRDPDAREKYNLWLDGRG
ncbi:hypothetical protein HH607_004429 [Escherichia coli]|nr:hypothetical protein [Escherichia coli]